MKAIIQYLDNAIKKHEALVRGNKPSTEPSEAEIRLFGSEVELSAESEKKEILDTLQLATRAKKELARLEETIEEVFEESRISASNKARIRARLMMAEQALIVPSNKQDPWALYDA